MWKIIGVIVPFFIIGCAGQATVEVGLNDESVLSSLLLLGTQGNIEMRVLYVELPDGTAYDTIWTGAKDVSVPLDSRDYVSITDTYEEISPGSFQRLRLTVDSVRYVDEPIDKMLIEAPYQFVAQAFSPIVVEEDDEFRLVVSINSDEWFDSNPDSLKIRGGYEGFEGARLKIFYE